MVKIRMDRTDRTVGSFCARFSQKVRTGKIYFFDAKVSNAVSYGMDEITEEYTNSLGSNTSNKNYTLLHVPALILIRNINNKTGTGIYV